MKFNNPHLYDDFPDSFFFIGPNTSNISDLTCPTTNIFVPHIISLFFWPQNSPRRLIPTSPSSTTMACHCKNSSTKRSVDMARWARKALKAAGPRLMAAGKIDLHPEICAGKIPKGVEIFTGIYIYITSNL